MASRQGWNPELTDFHFGGVVYSKGQETDLHIAMDPLQAGFRRFGSLSAWRDATYPLRLKPFAHWAFQLLIAFGSPLLPLVGGMPAIFYGKHRLLPHHAVAGYLMQSVWGDYRQMVVPSDESVPRSIERISTFGNLPPFVANPNNGERPKATLARLFQAFSYGQGIPVAKHYLEGTATAVSWSSIMLVHGPGDWKLGSEDAQFPALMMLGNRDIDRIIEQSHAISQVIATNFGVAGHVYAAWMANNRDRLPEWIMRASERIAPYALNRGAILHQINALACITVGGLAAYKLGLIAFDPTYAIEFGHESLDATTPTTGLVKREYGKHEGCITPGCKNKHAAKGYCKLCYQRIYMKEYMPAWKEKKKKASAKSSAADPPATSEA